MSRASQNASSGVPRALSVLYLKIFAIVLLALPAVVVLPGPLKSTGSPAILLALATGVLISVAFTRGAVGTGLGWPVFAMLLSAALDLVMWVVGLVYNLDSAEKASITRELLLGVSFLAVALTTMFVMRGPERRYGLVLSLVVGLTFSGVVGLVQAVSSLDLRYVLMPPGFVLNRDFSVRYRGDFARALGTTDSPIEFSVLMVCLVLLAGLLFVIAQGPTIRLGSAVAVVVGLLGIPVSVSRTGLLSLGFALLAVTLFASLRSLLTCTALLAAGIFGFILVAPTRSTALLRLFTMAQEDNSVKGREDDFSYVIDRFLHSPVFGNGFGSTLPSTTRFLDNQWFQSAIQGGLAGLVSLALVFVAGLGACIVVLYRPKLRDDCWSEAVAYFAVLIAIFVSSFTFDLFGFTQVRFVLAISIGLAGANLADAKASPRPLKRPGELLPRQGSVC